MTKTNIVHDQTVFTKIHNLRFLLEGHIAMKPRQFLAWRQNKHARPVLGNWPQALSPAEASKEKDRENQARGGSLLSSLILQYE